MADNPIKLAEAKRILEARGLKPIDYKHLPYEKLLQLAGLKP